MKISSGPCASTGTGPCSPPRANSAFEAATPRQPRSRRRVSWRTPSRTPQAAVWRCARDKTIVVSFRGTEMPRPAISSPTPPRPRPSRPARRGGRRERGCRGGCRGARVHGGFLSAYDSVRGRVFAAVDDVIAADPRRLARLGLGLGSFDECERGACARRRATRTAGTSSSRPQSGRRARHALRRGARRVRRRGARARAP